MKKLLLLFILCLISISMMGQKITGKVTDAKTGEALPGVTVMIPAVSVATTDSEGSYVLDVSDLNVAITFTLMGYKEVSVNANGKAVVDAQLEIDELFLDELVVIGYGVQKKVNLTGSIAVIDSKELESRPVTSTVNALQGLLPGVTIIQNSGQPGKDAASIRIRGIGTIQSTDTDVKNTSPMFILDGMAVSDINDVDPSDIASISILKDASSAAIYGSRASNGVILVTTKTGSSGAPKVKYSGYVGFQNPTNLQEYLPSWEYAELYNKALTNAGNAAMYTDAEIAKFKDGSDLDNYPNTDWLDLLYKKNALQQNHRVEVSGGGEYTNYMFSVGYLDQNGIIEHSDHNRYTVRTNITTNVKRFFAKLGMSYAYYDTNEPVNPYTGDMYQIFRQINRIAPFVTNQYSNGYYGYIGDGNPIEWLNNGSLRQEQHHITRINGNLGFEIIDGLKIQGTFGYEYKGSSDEKFIKESNYYNWETGGDPVKTQGPNSQTDKRTSNMYLNAQALLTYDKTFGKHTVGALLGYSSEYNRNDWTEGYRKDFLGNDLWELNAGSPSGQTAKGSAYEWALMSGFGRINYAYDNKYLFEASIRYDGTSRITEENRWGIFPSVSLAWRIINESFMDNVKNIFSDLKLRLNWGQLGNQNIGNYPYQSMLSAADYAFGGNVSQGLAQIDGANRNVMWETSTSYNIGLDLAFFANQLFATLDLYRRDTKDILYEIPVNPLFGLEAPFQNIGAVMNQGVELQVGYKFAKGDWTFDAVLNGAYNQNKVTNLGNDGERIWDGNKYLQEGSPINSIGGYRSLGLFQNQEEVDNYATLNNSVGPGDIKYEDINNDGKINGDDRVDLGSYIPAWTYGLSLNATFKGFDLGLQFAGAADVKGYLGNESLGSLEGNSGKPTVQFRDSWDAETNPTGKFPRPLVNRTNNLNQVSSHWVVDASYLRLKNIQFGYTLPRKITNAIGIDGIRVYYSGQNIFTISGFTKGYDPEVPYGVRGYYPQVSVHTFGLNISF